MTILSTVLIALSVVVAGGLAALAWRNRPTPGATPLAALMALIAARAGLHFLEHRVSGPLNPLLDKAEVAAFAPAAFLWFGFVLAFATHRRLRRRTYAALLAWPSVILVGIWLPPGVDPLDVWGQLDAEAGPVFLSHVALSYGLLAVGTAILLGQIWTTTATRRRQALVVLVGIVAAWTGSAISLFEILGDVHVHALPLGFTVMGGFLLWGIAETGLIEVVPIARDTVVRNLEAGVIAFDEAGRITDVNPAARTLLDGAGNDLLGRDVATVFEADPSVTGLVATGLETGESDSVLIETETAVLECELSPLTADGDRVPGGVLLLHDVTDRERRKGRLEHRNEQLETIRSHMAHDLRNPLNVASGNLDLELEERDSDRLDRARDAIDRMDELVDDLHRLTWAGNEDGDLTTVSLGDVARDAWTQVRTPAASLAVEDDLRIEAVPEQCQRLLENLFRNAVEHGGNAVTVRVGGLPTGDGFFIADDGVGVDPEDRERIFEAGYSTDAEGTGLGLAIVERCADAHDWTIAVDESQVGGARFDVRGVTVAGS